MSYGLGIVLEIGGAKCRCSAFRFGLAKETDKLRDKPVTVG